MDRLEELREDLWSRWRTAFDRIADLGPASQSGERVVYSHGPIFPLKNYTPRKFPAGKRVLNSPPENATFYCTYRLDNNGRPVHMACRHHVNNIDWEGFYRYAAEEVDYVEFCLQSGVVSEYSRLALKGGVPASFQWIDINGGGSHIAGLTGKEAIDFIQQSPYCYLIEVEDYQASDDRIGSGTAVTEAPGQPPSRSPIEYFYSDTGKLLRIVIVRPDGSRYTSFAARTALGMRGLAKKLSEQIAARTIEALKRADLVLPLVAVELSFRSVSNYVPLVIPFTEDDPIPLLAKYVFIKNQLMISLIEDDFEPEMAEFNERMDTGENWEPGSRMLRQAALLVTKLAPESLKIADCFVAYAIDWEFEFENMHKILKQCGASAATMKKLKKIGWLD